MPVPACTGFCHRLLQKSSSARAQYSASKICERRAMANLACASAVSNFMSTFDCFARARSSISAALKRVCVSGSTEAFSPSTKQRLTDALADAGYARDTRHALVCAGRNAVLNTSVDATDALTAKTASKIAEDSNTTDDHFIPARVASESAELGQWFDTKPGTLGPPEVLLMSVVLVHVMLSPELDNWLPGNGERAPCARASRSPRSRCAIAANAHRAISARARRGIAVCARLSFAARAC